MLQGEVGIPYEYKGIKFDICDKESFYYLERGSSVYLKMDRDSVYREILQMDRNSMYRGIPVGFLRECFEDAFELFNS